MPEYLTDSFYVAFSLLAVLQPVDAETQKSMMAFYHKKQEEQKVVRRLACCSAAKHCYAYYISSDMLQSVLVCPDCMQGLTVDHLSHVFSVCATCKVLLTYCRSWLRMMMMTTPTARGQIPKL